MQTLPLLRPGGAHLSLDTRELRDYAGAPLAAVSQAPPLLARLALRELDAAPAAAPPSALWPVLQRAGALLADGVVSGESPTDYAERVTGATGAPRRWVGAALQELAAALTGLEAALARQVPGGDPTVLDSLLLGNAAWVPRGRTLAVIAPSNHAATHFTWALALALGWRVAVRPGARDPFTPLRLAGALQAAGLPPERLAVLPGDHALVPALVDGADRAVVYGGEAVAAAYAGRSRVLVHGPGRSRVYVDLQGAPPVAALADFLAECILHDGGRKCTVASALVLRGDAAPLLAALAQRLATVPLLDPRDHTALVPAWPEPAAALALAETLRAAEAAGDADLAAARRDGPRLRQVNGATLLAPALLHCRRHSPLFAREWPAPVCTAVVLDPTDDPLPWLRGALVLTLVGAPAKLAARCLREPGIGKVFTGLVPTWHSEPGAPHNGRLSDFLFTAKAYREGQTAWT